MPQIFLPQKNLTLIAPVGENLMSFLQSQDIPVASSCLGEGICSMCRVQTVPFSPPDTDLEINSLKRNKCASDERLSCQYTIQHDITVRTKYW